MDYMLRYLFVFISTSILAQTEQENNQAVIRGKVIDEHSLDGYPEVQVLDQDMNYLTRTDKNGNFVIESGEDVDGLIFIRLGLEELFIGLKEDCNTIEVIVFEDANYDFGSLRKENRHRKKRFDRLAELHNQAYKKGIFNFSEPCFERAFVPHN